MKLTGSRYYPLSALVCLCATSSSLVSGLCGEHLITEPLHKNFAAAVAGFFILVLFGASAVALNSLLICGSEDVGCLTFGHRVVPALAVWTGYLLIFLLPWLGILALLLRF